jgi:phosphatidylglycerol:prolipoprotein diacylglycerol transferase
MHPYLFEIFGTKIPSYPVMMALGYATALWVLMRLASSDSAKNTTVERWQVWDLFIVMVVSSILGSKIGHTLFEAPGHKTEDGLLINSLWELLREDPFHWLRLAEGGYVWYGGMLGALSCAVIYFRKRPQLDAWHYSDLCAPSIMVGAFVGRLGCYMAGCCYGVATDVAWAVKFPSSKHAVHPTQLYDSLIGLTLFLILYWRFKRRKFVGENIAILLIAYPFLRASTEALRGDADRGSFGFLSTSQTISIPLLLIGVFIYIRRKQAGQIAPSAS